MRRLIWLVFLSSASILANAAEIPLTNWTVPPYRGSSASGGLTTMADISPGVGFVAMQPCRIVDTRGGGVFTGTYGPPALVANATRSFDINSAAHCTGIPVGVDAYSLNFTVVNTTGGPGDLRAWPTGNPPVQTTSVLNWTAANVIIANATIIGAGTGGSIDVTAAGFGAHLLIDINGYFTDQYNAGVSFEATSANLAPAILGQNTSTVANAVAIRGVITPTAPGSNSAAVRGINNGTVSSGIGIWGSQNGTGFGVLGTAQSGIGVYGRSLGTPSQFSFGTGVLGDAFHDGNSGAIGVEGRTLTQSGVISRGILGYGSGATNYAVYSVGHARVTGALDVDGDFSSANKFFIEPHPHDAGKEIRYVSLEGPHAEVYFRGTAQISRGVTRIEIPESFRFVADSATYSTLVTPLGAMATVAVISEGREGVVLQASRDVKVHYVVYAERSAVKNPDPIAENVHFRPTADTGAFSLIRDSYRRLLIQNGTLNADGTTNLDTARRMGWDKDWQSSKQSSPQTPAE